MATYLNTQDLKDAAKALDEYIDSIGNAARRMTRDAQDCNDNLGNDVVTAEAVEKISECAQGIQRAVNDAEDLKQRILRKTREIENLDGYFS